MNFSKTILVAISTLFIIVSSKAQTKNSETVNVSEEIQAVEIVMKSYKDAIQNLTVEGTEKLFIKEATVFESGGVEGTYSNYVAHHLGPELGHFNSFQFSNYKIEVDLDFPFAFTTETYIYTIDLKANKKKGSAARIITKKGVATSVLKKINGIWKIITTHSSSRNVKNN